MIDGWGSASVVCIGYSWWWGIAAWLVNSFVKSNEFAQKTLYFEANLILIDRKGIGIVTWPCQIICGSKLSEYSH